MQVSNVNTSKLMYKSLLHFVSKLEAEGELVRIKAFVNPVLEISEITDRMSKQPGGGKAILFENTGTQFPVITNMFGSLRRVCLALGVGGLDEFGELMQVIFSSLSAPKKSFLEKVTMLPQLSRIMSWMPVSVGGRGACQQVVCCNPDLLQLPILKCWPCDGGQFITLPMVHTVDPETGVRNVGMYRMQVMAQNLTGMHWHKHKTGARHFECYKRLKQKMPIAVTIGGDPAYTYAATAPMPDGMDEYMLAGFIRSKRVELVKCLTVDVEVPADVDFVIEGYVDPSEDLAWEGPFGDHTGFYSLADWYPSFHVTCITHRADAIYPATLVGIPPMEDAYIAKATERIFIEPIRLTMLPELVDMQLPVEGVAHNLALISLKTAYEGLAYKSMNTLWGAGQMMFNKILVAFDEGTNLNDYYGIAHRAVRSVNPEQNIFFGYGVADVLDHAADVCGMGSKLFIDATACERYDVAEINSGALVQLIRGNLSGVDEVNTMLVEKMLPIAFVSLRWVEGEMVDSELKRLCLMPEMDPVLVVVAVDLGLPMKDLSLLVWYTLANIDPKRDIQICSRKGRERANVAINAMRKKQPRNWPNVNVMDEQTIQHVDSIWQSLNIGPLIVSPSTKLEQLLQGNASVATFDE